MSIKSDTLHIRVPPSIHDHIKAVAAAGRWPVATAAAILIEEALEHRAAANSTPEPIAPAPKANPTIVALDAADMIKRELKQRGLALGSEETKLREILPSLPNVRDTETARAEGWQAWVKKRSGIGLINKLFWGDSEAIRLAERAIKDRINADRRWEKFGGVAPWYASVKLVGQAAGAAAKVPVKTLAEAQALGAEGLRRYGMAPMSIAKVMNTLSGSEG